MSMKIAVIGAGSAYTSELVEKLSLERAVFPLTHLALYDTDSVRLEVMAGFCRRFFKNAGVGINVTSSLSLAETLDGCAFIVSQIRVGGNRARIQDEKIPLSMGFIGQETTGAGGFAKALRTIPAMLEIARGVEKYCPDAWIINYTNPTGLVTEALQKYSGVKIAGLCAGGMFIRDWVQKALGADKNDVYYDYAGLNHMSFAYNITIRGRALSRDEFYKTALEVQSVDPDLIMRIGALPSPYLKHYYHTAKTLEAAKNAEFTRGEEIVALEPEIMRVFSDESVKTKPDILKKRGGGGYSDIACACMNAIYNNCDTWLVVNVQNRGTLPFLPDDAVIETPCIVNAAGIVPLRTAPPPAAVRGLIAQVKTYEQSAVKAAAEGDRDAALLALTSHPLVGDADAAEILLGRLLEANRMYLPQFFQK